MFNLYDINGVESRDYYIQPINDQYLIVKRVKNTVTPDSFRYIIINCVPINCMLDIINIVILGQQYYIDYHIFNNIMEYTKKKN
jgi:hypothetical protein